ncbi:protein DETOXIFICATION 16-like isoform X2 [Papaver somniferum]|uniref:protein DETOXIFICATION 16-like isoform X2 n=1 Tax=Papaver somniferum TaxID=3469 RepID=UPI000E6FD25B|nr:protein DETOXIFICATION 16-like isoform X2 [Papaver somniferum]
MERKNEKSSLDSPLILPVREENKAEIIIDEVKKQLWLSGPLITVNVLQFCIQLISIMFVGHLGELSLSGASMATSFATVTGFSLLMGMGSALDTLCGQSYGAKQYHMLGIHMQRGMLVLLLVSVPLSFIWANTGRILIAVGQDPEISAEAGVYARYMIPSLFAYGLLQCHISLEMWSFELMVLLSGLLPNPKLETSVLSICLNTCALVWMIPNGLGGAVSTRVSNELGAGHPQAARLAVQVVFVLAVTEGILIGTIMILGRHIWGNAYSNEKEVVTYVAFMMPILAVSNFFDGLQAVLSGTARGCGWQKIGALVNLGSYYLVGIPSAVVLAFVLHVGGKGLWVGIICALLVQVFSLLVITIRTNWEQEAKRASERVFGAAIPVIMVS